MFFLTSPLLPKLVLHKQHDLPLGDKYVVSETLTGTTGRTCNEVGASPTSLGLSLGCVGEASINGKVIPAASLPTPSVPFPDEPREEAKEGETCLVSTWNLLCQPPLDAHASGPTERQECPARDSCLGNSEG